MDSTLRPLAVVGMSMRFPQEATSADAFWQMLMSKRCASTSVPSDRWSISTFHHPDTARLDALSQRGGHFITENLAAFDAPFFSIGAAEAEAMDPAHRFTLETAYRALENAGIPIQKIAGSQTCVYTGCFNNDYSMLTRKDGAQMPKYDGAGTQPNMLANRVSWFFDLIGPSANVDTACSSSLMALDLVCQSIWNGDSTMGLACGTNLILAPEFMMGMDNLGFLSKDSRCFSFDHRANGYARGEGFAVVVIKPLDDALRDGDTIRAVIRSSSSNQDGKTPTLTQPSRDSQEKLIRQAYAKAGLDLQQTKYFEAHGTGTPVGDPIEMRAVGSVFRSQRSQEDPLYVGSVKSNIGHLEGASGLAGVIKVILSLEKGIIPPNSNFEKLNPKIDADFLNIKVPTEATPWPSQGLRRASVQSFGFGGSNSHVILDDAYNYLSQRSLEGLHITATKPPSKSLQSPSSLTNGESAVSNGVNGHIPANGYINGVNSSNGVNGVNGANGVDEFTVSHSSHTEPRLLVLSSSDEAGIERLADTWRDYLSHASESNCPTSLPDLAYTLGGRRTHLPWRTYAVAQGISQIGDFPDQLAPPTRTGTVPKLGFVFTGQGAQWHAMGRELVYRYPLFKGVLTQASAILKEFGCSWDVLDELHRDETSTNVNSPEYSQTLCTAVQVALIDLLESFGIRPAAVVGHSSGEIAAAYAARALDKHSALKVAYYRGVLAAKLSQIDDMKAGMKAVGLTRDDAKPYLDQVAATLGAVRLNIACVNSPKNLTISGEASHLDLLHELLTKESIFARKLKVTVAYHSFQMKQIGDEYLAVLGTLADRNPQAISPVMVSSVTGSYITADVATRADYWVKNMLQTVLFADSLATLCSQSSSSNVKKLDGSHHRRIPIDHLVEIGPHAALQGPSKEILRSIGHDQGIGYSSVLRRKTSAVSTTLEMCGRLHALGYPVDLSSVNNEAGQILKSLPTLPEYPFNHTKTYWHESRLSKDNRLRKYGRRDLLGTPSPDWNPLEAKWRNIIRLSEVPWLEDHKVNGVVLYPAMGMVVAAIEAAKQLAEEDREITGFVLKNVNFQAPVNVPAGATDYEVNTYLRPRKSADEKDSGWHDFRLCTYDGERWEENCNGSLQIVYASEHSAIDAGTEEKLFTANHVKKYESHARKCGISVDPAALYESLTSCGYNYGPAFQRIASLSYDGDSSVISDVNTFQWTNDTDNVAQPHTIHPTTLDAILHTIFTVYTKGGTEEMPTHVPTHVDRLWLSSKGLSHPEAESVKLYATTAWTGLRETASDIGVLDAAGYNVLVEVEGVATTLVSASTAAEGESDELVVTDKCYSIGWKPDLDLLSAKEVQSLCDAAVYPETEPITFHTDIDTLLAASISRTLRETDSLSSLKTPPHFDLYRRWLKHHLQALANRDPLSNMDDTDSISRLADELESTNNQGAFFATIARNMTNIVSGKINASDVLVKTGLEKEYYNEMWNTTPSMQRLAVYLDAYAHKNPGVKILEIGAGSGAMTNQLLKTLTNSHGDARYGRYDYTDISSEVLEQAKEHYRNQGSRMQFKTLDISTDPNAQGFEDETYDIIVTASTLYRSPDINKALSNCRKLLRSGGVLILAEITNPSATRTAFSSGFTESWWLGFEPEAANRSILDEDQWEKLLQENAFSGRDVTLRDFEEPICHEHSAIISTAVSQKATGANSETVKMVIIHGDEQKELAQEVQAAAESKSINFSVHLMTLEQAVQQPIDAETVVVSLLELNKPVLLELSSNTFSLLHKIFTSVSKLLWVTGGSGLDTPEYHLSDGLFRTLNSELGGANFTTVALQSQGTLSSRQQDYLFDISKKLSNEEDIDTEYAETDGVLHIHRLFAAKNLNKSMHDHLLPQQTSKKRFGDCPPMRLTVGMPGLLNTLHFVEDKEVHQPLDADWVEVEVQSVGLNFRDILIALGRYNQPSIGSECAGVIKRVGRNCTAFKIGDRVCATSVGSFRTLIRLHRDAVTRIPDSMSTSVAAAIPVNYSTTWHAFNYLARLQPGEKVLIHSGAGGTGQAAIQIAQHLGATVYTTVGSIEKREFIMERYNIPAEHIFSSRDLVFAQSIKRLTNGEGVDVVLNSLSGEGLVASWECIAPYGRFIEVGKKDIFSHNKLPMYQFGRNVTFSAVDLAAISYERPRLASNALRAVLPLIESGNFTAPEPLRAYGLEDLEKAFRMMQSGKNAGKVVIDLRPDDIVETVLDTKPSFIFEENASYVIAGGLGGLGRNVSRWFVERGARNLILLSRSGAKRGEAQALVDELTSKGANVRTPACDISNVDALKAALDACQADMPPIKGCIQSSMVLRDTTFENMSFEEWQTSTMPKVQGSWNLHTLLPRNLDFFVMFSSISGIIGNRGQANYAAGNSYMDALAKYRVARNEKATSIDLGIFLSSGVLKEDKELLQNFRASLDFNPMTEPQLLSLLDHYCNPECEGNPTDAQTVFVDISEGLRNRGLDGAYWLQKPSFRQVLAAESNSQTSSGEAEQMNFQTLFSRSSSIAEAIAGVTEALIKKLSSTLSLSVDELDPSRPMHTYGVDSLVGVELRNWFLKKPRADIAIFDILGGATIANVAAMAAGKSIYRKAEWGH